MAEYQVTCVRRAPASGVFGGIGAPGRIEGVGGNVGLLGPWFHTETQAILNIDAGDTYRVTGPDGNMVRVIVSGRGLLGRFLTTEPDGDPTNNLLSLPPCDPPPKP